MTRYEKRSLTNFLLIYLGSLFFLIALISAHFYHMQVQSIKDRLEYRMETTAGEIAKEIVMTHMHGGTFDTLVSELDRNGFKLSLFDFAGFPLLHEISIIERPTESFSEQNGRFFLIHTGTFDHLDVNYLILESDGIEAEVAELQRTMFAAISIIVLFISVIGYFLAKLFLRPIRQEIERLDQFVRDSAHELNTPVSSLLMSVKSLLKEQNEDKRLQRIEISTRRISDVYNDLTYLLLKDIERRNDEPMEMKPFTLERIEYFHTLAEAKEVRFETELEAVTLTIDRTRAERLVDNLLSNAVKYNKRGGLVRVTLTSDSLTVQDEGPGIPKEKQQQIFKRYVRGEDSGGGFGIGLDIVSSVCEEYGFRVELSCKNCFTVRFLI